jgi:hypothetical protein
MPVRVAPSCDECIFWPGHQASATLGCWTRFARGELFCDFAEGASLKTGSGFTAGDDTQASYRG